MGGENDDDNDWAEEAQELLPIIDNLLREANAGVVLIDRNVSAEERKDAA